MKVNELRIGNVTSAGIVVEIHRDHFYTHNLESSFRSSWFDVDAVTITEEWLIKFGFINDNGIEYPNYKLSYYTCMWRDGKTNICNNHGYLKNLKYVHELQNLYFALTGAELKLIP
jgi:hypothetical protein